MCKNIKIYKNIKINIAKKNVMLTRIVDLRGREDVLVGAEPAGHVDLALGPI
jgi:hypothetical protein